jgi:hypothetical protein
MAIKKVSMLAIVIILVSSISVEAAFQGPTEVASCQFGSDLGQIGLYKGDSGDTFASLEAVTPDGKIVVSDQINKKQLAYSLDGSLIKEVKWIEKGKGGGQTSYDIPEYSFGPIVGYSANGNIYTSSGEKYYLVSPNGQLLNTYAERPLELGEVKEKYLGPGRYKVTVKYPDKTWEIIGKGAFPKYIRDLNGNLYGVGDTQVVRYDDEGKELARLTMPEGKQEEMEIGPGFEPIINVIEEFGSPTVAPSGDVYTWKRTPDRYYIIKWVWQ